MEYTKELEKMECVGKICHENSPIPQEGKFDHVKEVNQISVSATAWGLRPQTGRMQAVFECQNGIIEEALVEVIGCSGMTQSVRCALKFFRAKRFWKR
jgi:NifU-like protein involved in Fe-S cluster formation